MAALQLHLTYNHTYNETLEKRVNNGSKPLQTAKRPTGQRRAAKTARLVVEILFLVHAGFAKHLLCRDRGCP